MRATENAFRAVIHLVEDSQLVNLSNIMLLMNVWPYSFAMVPIEKHKLEVNYLLILI